MKKFSSIARISITIWLAIIFLSCAPDFSPDIPAELIEFLTIEPAMTTRIAVDELFFANDYQLSFQPNENIEVKYNSDDQQLELTPVENFAGLTFIKFKNQKDTFILPVIVKDKIPITFRLKFDQLTAQLYVMGNFNDWNRSSLPMSDEDQDGIFTRTVFLDDGIYEYQFVTPHGEIFDPQNPIKVDNGFGYFNSLIEVKSSRKAAVPHLYFLPCRNDHQLRLAVDTPQNISNVAVKVLLDNSFYPDQYSRLVGNELQIDLKGIPKRQAVTTLRIVATNNNLPGNIVTCWIKDGEPLDDSTFLWQDAIIYSLMVDRFKNGNPANDNPIQNDSLDWRVNFQGGDFAGITEVIESGYFTQLGVNTLWISPINKTTNKAYREWPEPHRLYSGYHGYWPISENETEPRFGALAEFNDLVKIAHQKGIKILLDFVSNHTHIEHRFYQQHRDWFGTYELPDGTLNIRRWDEYRLTTWFDTFLSSFDYLHSKAALDTMTDNAVWWLQETGIDGFRHDATKHIPYEFWKTLTRKIKTRINPDRKVKVFQIGETFGSHELIKSYINNGMLESQFNFAQFFSARRTFTGPEGSFNELQVAIAKALEVYGYNHLMGNILDSHDQIRIMGLLEGDITLAENGVERAFHEPAIQVDEPSTYQKEQLLYCYLMTVPGIPIIYYGDEFGMTGANDPDNRRMMRFGDNLTNSEREQLANNTKLVQLRQSCSALRRGDYLNLYTDENVTIYSRGDTGQRLIIALNKNPDSRKIQLFLPQWMAGKVLTSLLDNSHIAVENHTADLKLPGFGYQILQLE
jgi:cyclomaltodextrinase